MGNKYSKRKIQDGSVTEDFYKIEKAIDKLRNNFFVDRFMVDDLMKPPVSKINRTLRYNKYMYVDKNDYWHGWDFNGK